MTWPEPIARALADLELKAPDDAPWETMVVMPGEAAFEAWKRLAEASRGNGYWPLILGPETDAAQWPRQPREEREASAAEAIADADGVDLSSFMLRGADEVDEEFDGSVVDEGEWPDAGEVEPQSAPSAVADHKQRPHARVAIGLFRADEPWQALARLGFGGWNDCPETAGHVARHRDWQARYGAVPCAATGDTLECLVASPPTTRKAAMKLAREHYFYCYDIVEQGTGDLATLAATLLKAPVWYFWWD